MKSVKLWSYTIFDNGDIINSKGKMLSKRPSIKLIVDGKPMIFKYLRVIYYAFNRDFDINNKRLFVTKKDKTRTDYGLDNLKIIDEKSAKQGENNGTAKLTNKEVEEIKEKYYNKDNARDKDGNYFIASYRKLGELYGVSHATIEGIVKGKFRNIENYVNK